MKTCCTCTIIIRYWIISHLKNEGLPAINNSLGEYVNIGFSFKICDIVIERQAICSVSRCLGPILVFYRKCNQFKKCVVYIWNLWYIYSTGSHELPCLPLFCDREGIINGADWYLNPQNEKNCCAIKLLIINCKLNLLME